MFGNPKLLIWISLAGAAIIALILVLATDKWWAIFFPLGAHAIGTVLVASGVFKMLGERDKPDPVTQARLDDEHKPKATS